MAKGYRTAFFAYPAEPKDLASTIAAGVAAANSDDIGIRIQGWPQLEIFGANIPDEVRKGLHYSDILVADVTKPNINVYYEIGYAIGTSKTVAPVLNLSFANAEQAIQRDGIFDNIGYRTYENSVQLKQLLGGLPNHALQELYSKPINYQQPLFLLQAFRKTDFLNSIASSIKDARVHFRSFDPVEIPRFSAVSMIAEISASSGVIIPLLAEHIDDAPRHNLRAAFLAGLSHGLTRQTLLLELRGDGAPRPTDFRDFITTLSVSDIPELLSLRKTLSLLANQSRLGTKEFPIACRN